MFMQYICIHYRFCVNTLQGQEMRGTNVQRDESLLAVGITEAARRLGLSPRTVATLIAQRELPSRKVGRRRIIPVAALEAFVDHDHSIANSAHQKAGQG
jgi:excisionase family DNA binding protein